MKKIIFSFMAVVAMVAVSSCTCSSHKECVEEEATVESLTDTTCVMADTVAE